MWDLVRKPEDRFSHNEAQIRCLFDDKLKDSFCQFSIKTYVMGARGDSNEHPQHMFLWRNNQKYPLIISADIIKHTFYLFFCT